MEFRILGALEVAADGATVELGGSKQRVLLAALLLERNRIVSTDRLIEALWEGGAPETASSALRVYVSQLRKVVGGERLETRAAGYVLRVGPDELDLARFERLREEEKLDEALALWRGPPLADFAYEHFAQVEIARLEELRLATLEERIARDLADGGGGELVGELHALVREHPLRERFRGQLMLALYRAGRQAEALTNYRETRRALLGQLGIEPSRELRELEKRILRQDASLETAGERLRGYRLLEQLGAGAFGSVHRALQPRVGREVAVKLIRPRHASDPDFVRRFEAEAQLVARLEHPRIVPLYDFWRGHEGAFLVMRYLRGGSLRDRLAQGALTLQDAAQVVEQVADALASAHRQGIVHRDVKPENVLFDEDGNAYLLFNEDGNAYLPDFGIARELKTAGLARPGSTSSPLAYYASPEEIGGEPPTALTDVYGLGILLYESLTARHPFAGSRADQALEKHLHEGIPPIRAVRSGLPKALEEVISRATATDPAGRYRDVAELAHDFRRSLAPGSRRIPAAA
jgi:DNA-binding SARP family transcriptional activator